MQWKTLRRGFRCAREVFDLQLPHWPVPLSDDSNGHTMSLKPRTNSLCADDFCTAIRTSTPTLTLPSHWISSISEPSGLHVKCACPLARAWYRRQTRLRNQVLMTKCQTLLLFFPSMTRRSPHRGLVSSRDPDRYIERHSTGIFEQHSKCSRLEMDWQVH